MKSIEAEGCLATGVEGQVAVHSRACFLTVIMTKGPLSHQSFIEQAMESNSLTTDPRISSKKVDMSYFLNIE